MHRWTPSAKNLSRILILAGVLVLLADWLAPRRQPTAFGPGRSITGRVLSHAPTHDDKILTRAKANVSPIEGAFDVKVVEFSTSESLAERHPVGSLIPITLPGEPIISSLPPRPSLIPLSLSLLALGLILWRGWHRPFLQFLRRPKPPSKRSAEKRKKKVRIPKPAPAQEPLEKLPIRTTTLYDGAFEFSYAEERTRIDLHDGTSIRINQYRPLRELSGLIPDDELLRILQSAKSTWKLPKGSSGKDALRTLVQERQITSADQFFINRSLLGLLFRDEVEAGRWHAWVRGVWRLSSQGQLLASLLSKHPAHARKAADTILDLDDLAQIAALSPYLTQIRKSAVGTTGDQRIILLAADLIAAVKEGQCPCTVYTQETHLSPQHLIKQQKMKKANQGKNQPHHDLACTRCQQTYSVTAKMRAGTPEFQWVKLNS